MMAHGERIEEKLGGQLMAKIRIERPRLDAIVQKLNLLGMVASSTRDQVGFEQHPARGEFEEYLESIRTFLGLEIIIAGTCDEDASIRDYCSTRNMHILSDCMDACTSLIAGNKLEDSEITPLLDAFWIPILARRAHLLSRGKPSDIDQMRLECKMIDGCLRWLLRGKRLTIKEESLHQLLGRVLVPLLKKSRKCADQDVHMLSGLHASFEGLCRCSDNPRISSIIESLRILTLNDERVLKWALDELDLRVDDFPDSLLDICFGSLLKDGQSKRVCEILDLHARPKAKSADDQRQRRRAAWMYTISLTSGEGEIFDEIVIKHHATMLGLLEDKCAPVRRQARLAWLKVALNRCNSGVDVSELVSLAVSKVIGQSTEKELAEASTSEPAEAHLKLLLVGVEADRAEFATSPSVSRALKFHPIDWLLLPMLQLTHYKDIPKLLYANLQTIIAHLPGKQLGVQLERMIDMYEELVHQHVGAELNFVLLLLCLRLYLERPDLPYESWAQAVPPIRRRSRRLDNFTEHPNLFYMLEIYQQTRAILNYSKRSIDVQFILAAIDFGPGMFEYAELDDPPRLMANRAKLFELLASRIDRQNLHNEENDRLIWQRFERSLSDRIELDYKIQMMMVVNYMSESERKRAYKEVMKLVGELDLSQEPKGIHNRRVLLQLLSKYIEDFSDNLTELQELIPIAIKLCTRLIRAYELRKTGDYAQASDCQMTCLEVAFATVTDDEANPNYECELDQFRNALNRIESKLLERVIEVLDAEQVGKLNQFKQSKQKLVDKTNFGLENLLRIRHICDALTDQFEHCIFLSHNQFYPAEYRPIEATLIWDESSESHCLVHPK